MRFTDPWPAPSLPTAAAAPGQGPRLPRPRVAETCSSAFTGRIRAPASSIAHPLPTDLAPTSPLPPPPPAGWIHAIAVGFVVVLEPEPAPSMSVQLRAWRPPASTTMRKKIKWCRTHQRCSAVAEACSSPVTAVVRCVDLQLTHFIYFLIMEIICSALSKKEKRTLMFT